MLNPESEQPSNAPLRLLTDRLELIAATRETIGAEMTDLETFARFLNVETPKIWPPPLNDENSMKWFAQFLEAHPNGVGWGMWYFILKSAASTKRVIGNGGFKGLPRDDGTVEVGYSVLEEHQRSGYASEAVAALVGWAFTHPEVTRVIAETYPHLRPSIRVLEKNGFTLIGDGSEPGVIRFELRRTAFEKK